MTNAGWDSKWPSEAPEPRSQCSKDVPWPRIISGLPRVELKPQGSNLVDDQQYLYFQCEGCQTILDPHTRSFATLQEHRVNAGWACKWNIDGMGYKVYCAECGEKV